jgi:2-dehydropantoate 2-reductase
MKVAVMGAGAVGCYFGGMLARAGHEVVLVGRGPNLRALQREGLLMETLHFTERVAVRASADPADVAGAALVLFCVKSTDTEAAAAAIAPHLAPGAVVASLQNGVDNVPRLAALVPAQVLPAVVYVAVEMVAPGHVKHRGRGELVLPAGEAGERVAGLLRPAQVPVALSDNVVGAQWAKLVVNCAFNALSGIAQLPFGPLLQGEGVLALMQEIVDECLAVAAAQGIEVPGDPHEALRRTGSQSGQYSSLAQDLARGRPTEVEHLNGYVARLGQSLGVDTPVNRSLAVLVRLMERRGRAAGA